MFWFWFFTGPALALAFASLRGERKRAAYVAGRLSQVSADVLPSATVIVPVKGEDHGLCENLAALAAQDYPCYEVIVVAHSAADIPAGVLPSGARVVLAHEAEPDTGEKVLNLRTAVRFARKDSQVFAFADSDGQVSPTWLQSLVAPLAEAGVGASTGYRWFAPQPPDFWSLMRSVWDAVIGGMLGPGSSPFAWGGSMAIRRETFYAIHVAESWRDTVSDDYALSGAVQQAGLRIVFAPGAMAVSSGRISGPAFLAWARRQLTITRVYRPRLWWSAMVAHFFYCGGMAAAVIASIHGSRGAEWALLAQLSPGMLKGANRATLAKAELPEYKPWFDRHAWVHTLWVPVATWVWLIALIASALGNRIEWRGNRYRLKPVAIQNGRGG
ncbi:MAG TPA: glycosyltransferase [Bryobacteraceae bacterium]|nr:glycosyltransferase [Bryobacteraceae bacterium]